MLAYLWGIETRVGIADVCKRPADVSLPMRIETPCRVRGVSSLLDVSLPEVKQRPNGQGTVYKLKMLAYLWGET